MVKRAWVWWALLAVVVAGMVGAWRLRPAMPPMEHAVSLQAEADCDSAQRACRIGGDGVEFELQLGSPVRPMQTFAIQLRVLRGSLPADAQVEMQFQMRAMDMGLNRYRLTHDSDGVWRGRAVLPVCTAGRSDWLAQLDISASGRRWQAELPFTATSP